MAFRPATRTAAMLVRGGVSSASGVLRSGSRGPALLVLQPVASRRIPSHVPHHPLLGLGQLRRMSSISADDIKGAKAADKEEEMRDGARSIMHFKLSPNKHPLEMSKLNVQEKVWENPIHHSVWTKEEVNAVQITHLEPKHWTGTVAYGIAQTLRFSFDLVAGFKHRVPDEAMWLNRMIFLETVAGVPGMVAGMVRHLHSLRLMKRDHGWIHTLLEEAENERMHLLTFMTLKRPGPFFRAAVVVTQGVFFNTFFLAYLVSPRLCHSLVGYIEEEAVKTYTHILEDIDAGNLPLFAHVRPPPIALSYWKLAPNASFRDLILAVRADEANHREVNHTFSALKPDDDNPFIAKEQYQAAVKVIDLPPANHLKK